MDSPGASPAGPSPTRRVRVVVVWTYISGYMASCWRALAARPDIDLLVVACKNSAAVNALFNDALMRGIPNRLMPLEDAHNQRLLGEVVAGHKPDVVVVCGWGTASYRSLTIHPALRSCRFVMGMDTPFQNTLRQRIGRHAYRKFFARIDRVVVTGERSRQLALVLGFPDEHIRRGVYGVDFSTLSGLHAARAAQPDGWPRRFLYMGRYSDEKGLDVMADAYTTYRAGVPDPWPLSCMGTGPLGDLLRRTPGVEDLGFVQPADQPAIIVKQGAFVLASRFDPWPLVIVEACAAGLPVLCTEACGSAVELVRHLYNGYVCATERVEALARGFRWMHEHHADLARMGALSRTFAGAYSAELWSERWAALLTEVAQAR